MCGWLRQRASRASTIAARAPAVSGPTPAFDGVPWKEASCASRHSITLTATRPPCRADDPREGGGGLSSPVHGPAAVYKTCPSLLVQAAQACCHCLPACLPHLPHAAVAASHGASANESAQGHLFHDVRAHLVERRNDHAAVILQAAGEAGRQAGRAHEGEVRATCRRQGVWCMSGWQLPAPQFSAAQRSSARGASASAPGCH